MSAAEKIIQKLQEMPESSILKILEYMEFLEYQQQKESDKGLQVAKERSEAYDRGKTNPLTKKEFWDQLKKNLG